MEFYEKPIAELVDFEIADSVMTLTPSSEELGDPDEWDD